MRTALSRWCVLAVASSLYAFLVDGGVFWGSPYGDFAANYGPVYFAVLWAADDARRTRYWPAYHYGLFLFLLAPIGIPHYILRTRGRSGWAFACGSIALLLLPVAAALAGFWLYDDLPDLRE